MIGPMRSGLPSVVDVYLTRGEGERFQWWRYFDGRYWSGGIWFGALARAWFRGRVHPLAARDREDRRVIYWREYKQDVA